MPARLSGERSEAAIECRHVPSGLPIEYRVVSSPAGKARSAAAAIVQLCAVRPCGDVVGRESLFDQLCLVLDNLENGLWISEIGQIEYDHIRTAH